MTSKSRRVALEVLVELPVDVAAGGVVRLGGAVQGGGDAADFDVDRPVDRVEGHDPARGGDDEHLTDRGGVHAEGGFAHAPILTAPAARHPGRVRDRCTRRAPTALWRKR